MYIVQCVSSFLSLLQILKSVYHIISIFENLKLKHCNNCLANKTFLAEKFKKLLPSEFGKVFSQLTWFKTFKLHLLHWRPVTTANIFRKIFAANPKHIFFDYQLVPCTLIFRQLARALARADACGRWSPYSSFPSFVSLSPCPSFFSSPCQLSSLFLLVTPPYPLQPLGSSIFASNNSSPPHPPPPRLSFSTSLESSHTP